MWQLLPQEYTLSSKGFFSLLPSRGQLRRDQYQQDDDEILGQLCSEWVSKDGAGLGRGRVYLLGRGSS